MGTIGGACPLVPERDVLSETQTTTTTTTHHSQELDKKKAKNAHHWKQTPVRFVRPSQPQSQRHVPITPPPTTKTRAGAAAMSLFWVWFVVCCWLMEQEAYRVAPSSSSFGLAQSQFPNLKYPFVTHDPNM